MCRNPDNISVHIQYAGSWIESCMQWLTLIVYITSMTWKWSDKRQIRSTYVSLLLIYHPWIAIAFFCRGAWTHVIKCPFNDLIAHIQTFGPHPNITIDNPSTYINWGTIFHKHSIFLKLFGILSQELIASIDLRK